MPRKRAHGGSGIEDHAIRPGLATYVTSAIMHAIPTGRSVARMNSPSCERSRGSPVACERMRWYSMNGNTAANPRASRVR